MKIAIINNLRFPTEKAHGYQISKMAEAYALLGGEVELIYPARKNSLTGDLFTYYKLETNFKTRELNLPDLFNTFLPSYLAYRLMSFNFLRRVRHLHLPRETVIISRQPEVVWFFSRRGYKTFYDAHTWPKKYSRILKFFLGRASGIIANSVATAEAGAKYGVNKILAVPNGVELSDFIGREEEVGEIKHKYQLDGKTTLAYAGHFYNWKGVETLIKAMEFLPADKYTLLLVGAGPRPKQKNIIVTGQLPHYEVAPHLLAADILVLPTAPASVEAEKYTSPLKLFEYLAAGRAIIASDLPSSRAVVSEDEAVFFTSGDATHLSQQIEVLAGDEGKMAKLGAAGQTLALNYTWAKRAEKIINFIDHA